MTPRQALLLLLALVGVAYVGALQAGFVWDDVPLVLRNRLTGDLANLPQFFAMDLWDGSPVDQGVSGYYRPLFLVSLAVDRALFGLSSVGAHAQSLLWHGIAVVLAFHLLRGWLGVERAFAAALVFGLHPIQSEAVIWVAARNDPMAAALGLGALCCLRAERPGPLAWAGAALLTLLAGLTKESVVLLPALGLVLDLGQGRRPTLFRASPLLLGLGLALGMRALAGVGGATWPEESGWRLLIAESPRLFGLLGSWLVWPAPLSAAHTLEWLDRSSALRIGLGALAGLGLLGAGLWPGETARARRAGLAWTALCLGPVLVPMFMLLGYSPALTQTAYRVGDSLTNIITPLSSNFPLVLMFLQRYAPKAGIGTLTAMMLPYTLVNLVAWMLMLVLWVWMGWPTGPGAPLFVPMASGGAVPGL